MAARPHYGRRLVPHVIDEIARKDPQREAFQVPRSSVPGDGWRVITFGEYANAINRCAFEIVKTCGSALEGVFPTIAYIGPQDARYVVLMVAAIKAGYKVCHINGIEIG
jgi:acyl-CoA synthetase (AMP-forming)/AMP-acid ligase II